MAEVNRATPEVNARIVYWGVEGAGKRTNLRVHPREAAPRPPRRAARACRRALDPTVTYEVLPIELGDVGGVRTRIEVLRRAGRARAGADAQAAARPGRRRRVRGRRAAASGSTRTSRASRSCAARSRAYGRSLERVPLVVQYNKRDLSDPYALEELHRKLDLRGAAAFEAVATEGTRRAPDAHDDLEARDPRAARADRGAAAAAAPAAPAAQPAAPAPRSPRAHARARARAPPALERGGARAASSLAAAARGDDAAIDRRAASGGLLRRAVARREATRAPRRPSRSLARPARPARSARERRRRAAARRPEQRRACRSCCATPTGRAPRPDAHAPDRRRSRSDRTLMRKRHRHLRRLGGGPRASSRCSSDNPTSSSRRSTIRIARPRARARRARPGDAASSCCRAHATTPALLAPALHAVIDAGVATPLRARASPRPRRRGAPGRLAAHRAAALGLRRLVAATARPSCSRRSTRSSSR